jgi:hypothetical protein
MLSNTFALRKEAFNISIKTIGYWFGLLVWIIGLIYCLGLFVWIIGLDYWFGLAQS